jgi:glycosyltransferase involved in cell wall biosynthesis
MPKISVIICTHNPREDYLLRVLAGLRAQTLPPSQWELLLIDNASEKPLPERFDLSWHPHSRHVREEELGLTPARLRGIREATADILVFVDDDTVLASDYLAQVLEVAEQWPFVGAWGGSCIPEYEAPVPDWVGDQIWRLTVLDVKIDVWSNIRDGFETKPVGAGICFRKNVGRHFAEWCRSRQNAKIMDRTGTSLTGYGDMDLCQSAIDMGLGTGRSTRLKLTHLIPSTRLTLDYFVRHADGDAASLLIYRAGRGLPVQKPKSPTLMGSIRWFLHRFIHRVPREQYEIQKAHQHGLARGWQLVEEYLATKQNRPS